MSYHANAFGAILKPMQYALAPLIGVLLTVMNSINSRFASAVGSLPAILVIHLVGLIAVSAVLAAKKERPVSIHTPLHLYSGGIVGVGTVFCCNAAYGNLSVSLAAALALFGQTVFSVVIDATGFLGRKKYPFEARTLPGLAFAALGIAVISGLKFDRPAYIPAALLSGILPTLTFSLNSQLAQRIGIFRSARANYLTGLSTTIAVIAVYAFAAPAQIVAPPVSLLNALSLAGPLLFLGGGLLGVLMVAAVNFVFPRLPALYATVLMFSGQALAGLTLDTAFTGAFDLRKLLGTFLVLAGLGANALLCGSRAST